VLVGITVALAAAILRLSRAFALAAVALRLAGQSLVLLALGRGCRRRTRPRLIRGLAAMRGMCPLPLLLLLMLLLRVVH
jgi:hypothetical protein